MGTPAYWNLAQSLAANGDYVRACETLERASDGGKLAPLVYLARLKYMHQRYEEAAMLMAEVERRVEDDDADTHFLLYLAYELGAGGGYIESKRNAFRHLEHVARSGEPRAQAAVGLHYWQGLNGVQIDLELAEYWLSEAARSGRPDILRSYKRFVRAKTGNTERAP